MDELQSVLIQLGQKPTDFELKNIMNQADIDRDGTINFEEFIYLMYKKLKDDFDIEQEVREAWGVFDREQLGSLNPDDLKDIMMNYGDKMSEADAIEMCNHLSSNNLYRINLRDVLKMLSSRTRRQKKRKS